jgi:uncharacterized protein YjbI with pentapeptide repeats
VTLELALKADCSNCFGLCCVALPFRASADFAIDKDAGEPCRNLQQDFGCGIHATLREEGFRGCTVFDCYGAGQKVAQQTYGGRSWREAPGTAKQMFAVFPVMRQLHELLWYLTEALTIDAAEESFNELRTVLEQTELLTLGTPDELELIDVDAHRVVVAELLERVSEAARASAPRGPRVNRVGPGADLMGANLSGADLRAVSLRGAYLIAADLSRADLRLADVIGVDLRDADLCGADLSTALFLTQFQVNAAKGDSLTRLPDRLDPPPHWR